MDFDGQVATISMRRRDIEDAPVSTVVVPFSGSSIDGFRIAVHRGPEQNHGMDGQGIDNLFFFSKMHSYDTITEILPFEILPQLPEGAGSSRNQSWFITVPQGSVASQAGLNLPTHANVRTANDLIHTVEIASWEVFEAPHALVSTPENLEYDSVRLGVFSFRATLVPRYGYAVNRMDIPVNIFVENRRAAPETVPARSAEWLDRGVVAVPVANGTGNLVSWRMLATEYAAGARFNVFRDNELIASNLAATNFVDRNGETGDSYSVEIVGGERSLPVRAWPHNRLDIPVQRPASRPNPALAFGAADLGAGDPQTIEYNMNDMSVADVTGSGRYDILVRWTTTAQTDPGLANRHTGETIFDLYTLEGELLWRINLGVNITTSEHHSPFYFFDLDQDGFAEFAIKTADGTRVYHPDENGIIRETFEGGTPVYIIGGNGTNNFYGNFNYHALLTPEFYLNWGGWVSHPGNVWVGGAGVTCPVRQVTNTGVLGRVNNGPEFFTIFNGQTGLPIDTVEFFAAYGINRGAWGDGNNNRSDRFGGMVAFLPLGGIEGAAPYPSVIEVRGHYGPHFAAAYQLVNGRIEKIWQFVRTEWSIPDGGNHNMMAADADRDGFDELFFGSMALRHDGTVLWSANGTRGTIHGSHGDAIHVGAMLPGDTLFVMSPREAPTAFNAVVYHGLTGEMFWGYSSPLGDVGRGIAANVTPLPGFDVWASGVPMHNMYTGHVLMRGEFGVGEHGGGPTNHRIYWDGSLMSNLLDGPNNQPLRIFTVDFFPDVGEVGGADIREIDRLIGTLSINGTKANPNLQADIFGDWREEILVRTDDNLNIRIYTTNIPTYYSIYSLMHDPTYRVQVATQNVVYNQPPHLGFYLGASISQQVLNWELPVPNLFFPNAPETVEVTFNARGGTFPGGTAVVRNVIPGMLYGGILSTAPVPTRTGYTFIGWETSNEVAVNETTEIPDANHTLYAVWEAEYCGDCDLPTCEECNPPSQLPQPPPQLPPPLPVPQPPAAELAPTVPYIPWTPRARAPHVPEDAAAIVEYDDYEAEVIGDDEDEYAAEEDAADEDADYEEAALPPPSLNVLIFTVGNVNYLLNAETRVSVGAPFIDPATDRMMIPLRTLAEALGAEVEWDSETRSAIVHLPEVTLVIPADEMLPDGMGSAIIVDDRVFIPLRFVMYAFAATVEWDSENRAAVITW